MTHTQDRVTLAVRVEMALRRERQTDLARVLGVTQSAVSARFRGSTKWSMDDLDKLSDHFGVSVGSLVDPPSAYMRGEATGTEPRFGTDRYRTRRRGGLVLTLPIPRTAFVDVAA